MRPQTHPTSPANPRRSPVRLLACILPATAIFLAGCSDSFAPAGAGSTPITNSTEIATGAWTIGGLATNGAITLPIGGFYGALTASGTAVSGAFSVASASSTGSIQGSACAPNIGYSPAIMSGTASNGKLTLDSTFNGNQFHLTAQLSADRRSILSGTFVVSGSCATTAANIFGYQTAPITGTYVGTSMSTAGVTKQITATIVQSDIYFDAGYIPVTGTVLFQGTNCSATMELNGSFVAGDQSWFEGYTASATVNDALMLGDDDSQNSQYSSFITVDPWSYNNPACGAESQSPLSSTVLKRQ